MAKRMSKTAKSGLIVGILFLIGVCLGTVIGGDVVVKQGDLTAGMALSITNADFSDGGTGWTVSPSETWYFADGLAKVEGDHGATLQPTTPLDIVAGRIYEVEFDIACTGTDYVDVSLGGDTWRAGDETGSITVCFLASNTNNLVFTYYEEDADLVTVDNVVVRQYNSLATGKLETSIIEGFSCTASDLGAVALGYNTVASGWCSFAAGLGSSTTGATANYCVALGYKSKASGPVLGSTAIGNSASATAMGSTAIGYSPLASGASATAIGDHAIASGTKSTAIGEYVDATGYSSIAMGRNSTNSVGYSFTVGYGYHVDTRQVDFRVSDGQVDVYGDLDVDDNVDADTYSEHSSFFNKDTYGRALDYAKDSSETIKVNADGKNEYDHEADPEFLKKWVTVKDYDKYTDKTVWNAELQEYEPVRSYETHEELRSSLSMKVAWLRQCVFELNQENETVRAELAAIKQKLGME